jgi:hypothetical protein
MVHSAEGEAGEEEGDGAEQVARRNMAKDRWAKWDRTRQMGFGHFVLVHGVMGYGILFAVITAVLDGLDGQLLTGNHPVAGLVISSLVGGFFWGIMFWYLMEWLRNRARAKSPPPASN